MLAACELSRQTPHIRASPSRPRMAYSRRVLEKTSSLVSPRSVGRECRLTSRGFCVLGISSLDGVCFHLGSGGPGPYRIVVRHFSSTLPVAGTRYPRLSDGRAE